MISPTALAETIAAKLRELDTIAVAEVTEIPGNRAEIHVETQGGTDLHVAVGLGSGS